ncbi:PREDICTED: motile sperm domain-containing protein 1-like isoform X2 [Priapulus caudatus]|uniref:Motile sperm domain-containing protein 1-like isoform X2 n=1 Tax=Priapulus caudatus TaxID=37621 RepID=A0ABM1DRH0_PRICU|nr:PREDICTED: motile sperm domain-containing protein 1-like isoform X2 [Priapulus caudatus]
MNVGSPLLSDGKLPVFLFPTSLSFFEDDQSSHKQVLTIYNPYEFALRFRVLSTAPSKYLVADSEGTIKPQCCIDIVIRHTAINSANYSVTDKFRVQVYEHSGSRQIIGKRDVPSTLLPGMQEERERHISDLDQFEQLPRSQVTRHQASAQYRLSDRHDRREGHETSTSTSSIMVIMVGVLCVLALMLPLVGDQASSWPDYLHISIHQKLISAYVLGLITVVLLRPT